MPWNAHYWLLAGLARLLIGVVAVFFCSLLPAQMCKWVDENGVTHYAQRCPDEVEGEQLELAPGPSEEERAKALSRAAELIQETTGRMSGRKQPHQDLSQPPPTVGSGSFSLAEVRCPTAYVERRLKQMEAECERARERQIAPFRDAEIAQCMETGEKSPRECREFYANWLNANTPPNSGIRGTRAFDHLPECQAFYHCRFAAGLDKEWESSRD